MPDTLEIFPIRIETATASTCASPTGDEMWEDFEGSGLCAATYESVCRKSWTVTGTTVDFDAASPAGSAPNTACTNSCRINASAANAYITWDRGSAFDNTVSDLDLEVYIYIDSASLADYSESTIFVWGDSDPSTYVARVILANADVQASPHWHIFGGGDGAGSTARDFTLDTWHKIVLHLDITPAESYFQLDGGTQDTFTRYSANRRYLHAGAVIGYGSTESLDIYWGYILANSP